MRRFFGSMSGPVALHLNVAIERGFAKHGTSIATQLLVFDKSEATGAPLAARTNDFHALCDLVNATLAGRLMNGRLSTH